MLLIAALLCLSLMTGCEICVAVFVNPLLRELPENEQVPFLSRAAKRLGFVMPFWYATSLLLTAASLFVFHHVCRQWRTGTIVSAALQVVIIAMTVSLMVPMNSQLGKLTPGETGWTPVARHWDTLHQIRVVLLLVAVIALAI